MTVTYMNQSQYAEYQHVSRKTVTIWKQKGLLVTEASDRVNVAATDARLRGHFGLLLRNRNAPA
ncbi:hypothetical protein GCM10007923_09340 [Shinella yambaruensis]|uniref:DNA-binding protein n=1 Tax=Shinella yambaruensis TaxID=415996 RepID=A0ABQ5ZDB4_9HYPH|nr:hypothetical protein GCM10007923_09340 [Shinella yambaruensis]